MRIATWNVNSVKARLPLLLDWLDRTQPDVALLQETKTVDEDFPRLEIEARGYHLAISGQKTYNGVAILSRQPILAPETSRNLPAPEDGRNLADAGAGEARYVEAKLGNGVRVASIYVPMGQSEESDRFPVKLRFLDALHARAADLLRKEEPFVLGGDYNVAPEPADTFDVGAMEGNVLYHPECRRRLRRLLHLGLTDAWRSRHPREQAFSWWDYRAGAWSRDLGLRIDHLLLSPQATDRLAEAGIDREERGREKCSDHVPVWCELEI